MRIDTIYDEIEYIDEIDLLNEIEDDKIIILRNDPKISMVNGGQTEYYKENKKYYSYSHGPNWRDIMREERDIETIKRYLKEAIDAVKIAFEEYGYDTDDTNASYITIESKEEEW